MDDSRDEEDHAIIEMADAIYEMGDAINEMGDAIYEVVMLSMRWRRSQ